MIECGSPLMTRHRSAYLGREVEPTLIAVQIAVDPDAIFRVPTQDAVLGATFIPVVEGAPVVVLGTLLALLEQPSQSGELQGGVHSVPTYSRRHFSRMWRARSPSCIIESGHGVCATTGRNGRLFLRFCHGII